MCVCVLLKNGLNALHLASKEGHAHIVSEVLKRGANVNAATKVNQYQQYLSNTFNFCIFNLKQLLIIIRLTQFNYSFSQFSNFLTKKSKMLIDPSLVRDMIDIGIVHHCQNIE